MKITYIQGFAAAFLMVILFVSGVSYGNKRGLQKAETRMNELTRIVDSVSDSLIISKEEILKLNTELLQTKTEMIEEKINHGSTLNKLIKSNTELIIANNRLIGAYKMLNRCGGWEKN